MAVSRGSDGEGKSRDPSDFHARGFPDYGPRTSLGTGLLSTARKTLQALRKASVRLVEPGNVLPDGFGDEIGPVTPLGAELGRGVVRPASTSPRVAGGSRPTPSRSGG